MVEIEGYNYYTVGMMNGSGSTSLRVYNVRTSNIKSGTRVYVDGVNVTGRLTTTTQSINGNAHTCYWYVFGDSTSHEVCVLDNVRPDIYGRFYNTQYTKLDASMIVGGDNDSAGDSARTFSNMYVLEELDFGTSALGINRISNTFADTGRDTPDGCLIKGIRGVYVKSGGATTSAFRYKIRFEEPKFYLKMWYRSKLPASMANFMGGNADWPKVDVLDLSGCDFSSVTNTSDMLPSKECKILIDKDFNLNTQISQNYGYEICYPKGMEAKARSIFTGSKCRFKECVQTSDGELILSANYNGTTLDHMIINGVAAI